MAHNHSTGVREAGTQFGALSVAVFVVGAHARVASQSIAWGGREKWFRCESFSFSRRRVLFPQENGRYSAVCFDVWVYGDDGMTQKKAQRWLTEQLAQIFQVYIEIDMY